MKFYAKKERYRYNAEERNGEKYRICSAEQISEQTSFFKLTTPLCKKNVWMIKSKRTRM